MNRKKTGFLILAVILAALVAAVLATPVLIDMKGNAHMSIGRGEVFEDPGAEVRFGLGKIKTEGEIDTSQLGDQTVSYRFLTEKRIRTVSVEDRTRPLITLEGAPEKYLVKGEEYAEAGYRAEDDVDGDITDRVSVESDLDADVPGEYHISYTVSDSAGNAARERRKITVVEEGPLSQDRLSFDLGPFFDDVICKEADFDQDKYSSLIYFGDSFIGNLGDYGVVDYSQLWSRGSLGTDTVYDSPITVYGNYDGYTSFFGAMDAYHPAAVLVLLNSDRTLYWTPEYLGQSCDTFYGDIKERYPDTRFIICSITPVDAYYSSYAWIAQEGFDRNDRINKMNALMCGLCRKYGFEFMNAAEVLKNPGTGCCYDEYMGEDGIHLNHTGYSVMTEYVKGHMDW